MAVGIGFGWECRGDVGRVLEQGIGEGGWHIVGKKPLRRGESQGHVDIFVSWKARRRAVGESRMGVIQRNYQAEVAHTQVSG